MLILLHKEPSEWFVLLLFVGPFEEFNILNSTKYLGPHGPPAWETAEDIAALYKLLDSVGCKLQVNLSDIKRDKKDQARNQLPETK